MTGSPQPGCQTCFGAGFYWDVPSEIFIAALSFRHLAFSSDEPGMRMSSQFGLVQHSEPALTIPYRNPQLAAGDPRQPTNAWNNFSINDILVMPDMTARYSAILQVGAQENLPFQQGMVISPSSAVTIWDPATQQVAPVISYTVSGPTVTLTGYPEGTFYMVEYIAAALYVAFRPAGALPHARPFAGGTLLLPRAFRLQALDFWTRQRGVQPQIAVGGALLAFNIGIPSF